MIRLKDIELLKKELKKCNNTDLSIRMDGSLRLSLQIHNAECIVTKKVVIISNSDLISYEEIEISVDDINDMEIDTEIILEMNGNYKIYIST